MTRERLVGIFTAMVAVALAIYAVYGDATAPQDQKDSLKVIVPFLLIASGVVFGVILPWAMKRSPAKAGLIVSIIGFLSLAAFWSGLPIVLGSAGATLGSAGRERAVARQGMATAALAVGIVVAVLAIAATVVGNLGLV